nr:hypothetical protein GCM10025730_27560 [Promicromonospora thailandica]
MRDAGGERGRDRHHEQAAGEHEQAGQERLAQQREPALAGHALAGPLASTSARPLVRTAGRAGVRDADHTADRPLVRTAGRAGVRSAGVSRSAPTAVTP